MAQKLRFVGYFKAGNILAIFKHFSYYFRKVIHVALCVHPAGEGQSDQFIAMGDQFTFLIILAKHNRPYFNASYAPC